MKMLSIQARNKIGVFIVLVAISYHAIAATTPLAQFPPGNASRDPAPNVIVSVDDSGSMKELIFGGVPDTEDETEANPKKIKLLRDSLRSSFATEKIADGRIRLAWQSMWGCIGFPGVRNGNPGYVGCPANTNLMGSFEGTHRTRFNQFVEALAPASGTPSHAMIRKAGEYMKNNAAPWRTNPNDNGSPMLECRKTYHIFLTDGEWNSLTNYVSGQINNADGTSIASLPDGVASYDANSAQTRVYSDVNGGDGVETLSDLVFYYWSTDLRGDMANGPNTPASGGNPEVKRGVQPLIRFHGVENVGGFNLEEYWNPKNDPATWQHITQYTIGFGAGAVGWNVKPFFDTNTVNNVPVDSNYSNMPAVGGYFDLVKGLNNTRWQNPTTAPSKRSELWHMALNGRGKYFPARDASSLTKAFDDILANIQADTSTPLVSLAVNSTSLGNDNRIYVAGYDANFWSGAITAKTLSFQSLNQAVTTDLWNTAVQLDVDNFNVDNRLILTHNGNTSTTFFYDNLNETQKAFFDAVATPGGNGVTNATGEDAVNYIRGSHDKEKTPETNAAQPGPFRDRNKTIANVTTKTRQGDIVNSNIAYVGVPNSGYTFAGYENFQSNRVGMIYVGGNDGMLHGFDDANGNERIAYIPKGVISNLPKLTDQGYGDNSAGSSKTHLYYVDGSPFTGDVIVDGGWTTLLVGTLGAGGKGYFILDVTDPTNFSTNSVFSDFTYAAGDNTDPDMGFIFGDGSKDLVFRSRSAQFAQVKSSNSPKPFVLIMGNGYNSTNGNAVLYIQSSKTGLAKVQVGGSAGPTGGLSTPTPIDLNNDGAIDIVYAGDVYGHMWRFDFTNYPSVPSPSLVFTTIDNQPITIAPTWAIHPSGGIMLGFGTGQNLTTTDSADTTTKYKLYGVWDRGVSLNPSTDEIVLSTDTVVSTDLVKRNDFSSASNGFRSGTALASNNSVEGLGKKGWYIDLPNGAPSSERALNNPTTFAAQFVIMPTVVPSTGSSTVGETCSTATGQKVSWVNVLDLFNGTQATDPVFDTNNDGVINSSDIAYSGAKFGSDTILLNNDSQTGVIVGLDDSSNRDVPIKAGLTNKGKKSIVRAGWRQVQ